MQLLGIYGISSWIPITLKKNRCTPKYTGLSYIDTVGKTGTDNHQS